MSLSGMAVDDQCKLKFLGLKAKRSNRQDSPRSVFYRFNFTISSFIPRDGDEIWSCLVVLVTSDSSVPPKIAEDEILEDNDIDGNEMPLGKLIKHIKSQKVKARKAVDDSLLAKAEKAGEDVDVLSVVREINLDGLGISNKFESSNGHGASGMAVDDQCKLKFLELKAKRSNRQDSPRSVFYRFNFTISSFIPRDGDESCSASSPASSYQSCSAGEACQFTRLLWCFQLEKVPLRICKYSKSSLTLVESTLHYGKLF